jgi:hypothetical protein
MCEYQILVQELAYGALGATGTSGRDSASFDLSDLSDSERRKHTRLFDFSIATPFVKPYLDYRTHT